jgi:hypothetical protein
MNFNQLKINKPIVIMRIMGGLASQMHKYGIGRSLADQHKCDFLLDLTWFEKQNAEDTTRDFLLDKFNTRFLVASSATINELKTGEIKRKISSIVRKFGFKDGLIKKSHYIRSNTSINVFNVIPSAYIEGEWFGGQMINEYRDNLLNDFSLRNELSQPASLVLNNIRESESVAIHVRRGDLVSNSKAASFHCLTNAEYYKSAIDYVKKKLANPRFFVFSDDIEWAKENLAEFLENPLFVHENMPHEDIHLIKSCHHQIIANSGFGWFGAWLNSNQNKTLVAPKAWVNNSNLNEEICKDLLKNNFILI